VTIELKPNRKISVCEKCPNYIYYLTRGYNWKDEEYQCVYDGWYTIIDGINSTSGHQSLPYNKYIMWKLPSDCPYKLEHAVMEQENESSKSM